jgi:RHS repeat-associated protein
MNPSRQASCSALVAERGSASAFPRPRLAGRFGAACLLVALAGVLAPAVSRGEVDPLSGLYRLQQTDLSVRFQSIRFEVTRQFDGSLTTAGLDQDGWTFRPMDKRILPPQDEDSLYLQNGAELAEFVRSGQQGDYTSLGNERIVRRPDGFVLYLGDGTEETYDNEGVLTAVATPGGPAMHLKYLQGRLAAISAAGRDLLTLQYNPGGLVERIEAYNGDAAGYRYDGQGLLASATDQNNMTTRFQYHGPGRISRVDFQTGDFVQLDYDKDSGRVQTATTRDRSVQYAYREDKQGEVCSVAVTLPSGTEKYEIRGGGSIVEHTDALGNRTTSLYANGRLARYSDARMDTVECRYDERGRLVEWKQPDGGAVRFFYWEDTSLPAAQLEPDGAATHFTYNDKHQLTLVREPSGRETHYAYNAMGLCETITCGNGDEALREQYEYDDTGLLTGWKDSLGRAFQYEYDPKGRLVRIGGSGGGRIELRYDERGIITEVSEGGRVVAAAVVDEQLRLVESRDERGLATRLAYDAGGRLQSITMPTGGSETYQYDDCGRLAGVLGSDGGRQSYGYNPLGLLTELTSEGKPILQCRYDAVGRLVEARRPIGAVGCTYDGMGRPVAAAASGGDERNWTYDSAGRLTAERDSLGTTRKYRYNRAGELVGISLPNGEETRYNYDPDGRGRLVGVFTPDGRQLSYAYDPVGRLIQESRAWDETLTYAYDAGDRLVRQSSSAGGAIDYEYDQLGRQVKLRASDGYQATYEYDDNGDLARVAAPGYEKVLRYDTFGRLAAEAYPILGVEVRHAYDQWNRRTSLEIPGRLKTAYVYDDRDRLAAIDWGEGNRVEFVYDDGGRRSKVAYPNGVAVLYEYDAAGPVSRVAYTDRSGNVLEAFGYERDAAGRVVKRTNLSGEADEFRYDVNGQLVEASSKEGSTNFEYAPGSRRAAETTGGQTRRFQYNEAGQMIQAGDAAITYDGAGNMASKSTPGETRKYAFDALGRLSRIENGPRTAQYSYSPNGDRIAKQVDGKTTHYLYDGLNLLMILDEAKQPLAHFVHGPGIDDPLAMLADGQTHYYLPDHLGSIAALSDASGQIVTRYSYDPFGRWSATGRQTPNPFAFTARFYDPESELYSYRARYYDPGLGVFLSPDPFPESLAEPEDFNDYAYVRNDPVNSTDSLGWHHEVIETMIRVMEEERRAPIRHMRAWTKWEMGDFWGRGGTPPGKVSPIPGGYTHWEVGKRIHQMRQHLEYLKQNGFEGDYQVQLQEFRNQLYTHYLPRRVGTESGPPDPTGEAAAGGGRRWWANRALDKAGTAARTSAERVGEAIRGEGWSELTTLQKTGRVAAAGGKITLTAIGSGLTGYNIASRYVEQARAEGRTTTRGEKAKAAGEAVVRAVAGVVTAGGSEGTIQIVSKVADTFQAARALSRYEEAKQRREDSAPRKLAATELDAILTRAQTYLNQLEAIKEKQDRAIADARQFARTASQCLDRLNACQPIAAPDVTEAERAREEADRTSLAQAEAQADQLRAQIANAYDTAKSQAALAMQKTIVSAVELHVDAAEQAAELAAAKAQELAPIVDRVRALRTSVDACDARLQAAREERRQAIETLQAVLDEVENDLWGLPEKALEASQRTHACAEEARGPHRGLENLYERVRRIEVETAKIRSIVEVVYSGQQLRNQIEGNRRNADADSQLGETLARDAVAKFKSLQASLEAARIALQWGRQPRGHRTDLEAIAAAAVFATRARAYADQARRYLASLTAQPDGRDEIVPSLVGMMPKEAVGIIAKRWQAAWIGANAAPPTKEDGGRIASQNPEPGTRLEKGLTIQLDVYPAYKEPEEARDEAAPSERPAAADRPAAPSERPAAADRPAAPDRPGAQPGPRLIAQEGVYRGTLTALFQRSMLEALNENPGARAMQATFPRLTSTEMTLRIANDAATITPITLVMEIRLGGTTSRITETWEFRCDPITADGRLSGQCSVKPPANSSNSSPGIFFGAKRLQWEATRQDDVFTLRCIFTAEMIREWSAPSADSESAYVKKWLRRVDDLRPGWRLERVNE